MYVAVAEQEAMPSVTTTSGTLHGGVTCSILRPCILVLHFASLCLLPRWKMRGIHGKRRENPRRLRSTPDIACFSEIELGAVNEKQIGNDEWHCAVSPFRCQQISD